MNAVATRAPSYGELAERFQCPADLLEHEQAEELRSYHREQLRALEAPCPFPDGPTAELIHLQAVRRQEVADIETCMAMNGWPLNDWEEEA